MLNATEYEVLEMFADGSDPATISDNLGMPLLTVGDILNKRANRKRTVARELINQQKPPARIAAQRADSPLTAPIVKPAKPAAKDRATEVPARLHEEPVPADSPQPSGEVAPAASGTAGATRPTDLDSMDALHLAAMDIPDLRDQAIAFGNQAAELRSKVLEHRRTAAVKEEIAQLEARLAELRAVVAA